MTAVKRSEKQDQNVSPSTRIVQLVTETGAVLFHTANYEAFATIYVKGHFETWRVRDTHFKRWISGLYYSGERSAPSEPQVSAAMNVLEGKAIHEGRQETVHVRAAERGSCIYIDLANDRWETVEISPQGWRVLARAPVKFRRTPGMLPLPTPIPGGTLADMRPFVNVGTDQDFLLILGWLVASVRPTGPFPILILEGNQGSSKSTTSRLLRSLIDPSTSPLRSTPKNERDLMISAENSWYQAFENVSWVSPWLSDSLCRLATGGGFSTRRNYTDDEEKLFNAMRPIMLNGISVGLERGDALDRSLLIPLAEIPAERRMSEAQYWAEVEKARPLKRNRST